MRKLAKGRGVEEATLSYQDQKPLYDEFALKLSELIRELLTQESVTYQAVEHRAKAVDSLREKLRRPGKAYKNGIADITDLCGLRVITYSLDDVRRVCELVQREFDVNPKHTVDKGATLAPSEFGYRSRHFVVKLSEGRSKLAEWKRFSELRAEIQVRTVLEHAWSAIDHSLRYKRDADVPREQKRALFQLSALLELADDNFDRLKRQQNLLRGDAEKRIGNSEDKTLELNSLTYSAFEESSAVIKELMAKALEAGFEPPSEVYLTGPDDSRDTTSDLIAVAHAQGIRTIHELDRALHSEKTKASAYFKDLIGESENVWVTTPTFVAVLCLIMRSESVTKQTLEETGFHTEIANRVLRVAARHRATSSNR